VLAIAACGSGYTVCAMTEGYDHDSQRHQPA
jgi:hypothetical protein